MFFKPGKGKSDHEEKASFFPDRVLLIGLKCCETHIRSKEKISHSLMAMNHFSSNKDSKKRLKKLLMREICLHAIIPDCINLHKPHALELDNPAQLMFHRRFAGTRYIAFLRQECAVDGVL